MREVPPDAWRLLAVLSLLNVLNYVDRQLVAALAPLLIADLGLTRAQIGLLVGPAFILVFALMTLVFGRLADRVSRPRLIAAGVAVWSAGTALSGAASGLRQLALLRVVVGVGEATLGPTALAMLGDRFPAPRLGFAAAVFYAGIPVGFAMSFVLAGWIGPWLGWRACFFVLGLAGLLAVAATSRLGGASSGPARAAPVPGAARAAWRAIVGEPLILALCLSGAGLAFLSGASQHTITWLVQERGLPYAEAAWLSALMLAAGGLGGNLALGALTDWCRRRHPAGRVVGLAILGALAMPCVAGFYLLPAASPLFYVCWFLAQAFVLGWFGPLVAALDEASPPGLRATTLGFGLVTINLLGVAPGPWVTGLIGDRATLTQGLLLATGVAAAALVLLLLTGLRLARRP